MAPSDLGPPRQQLGLWEGPRDDCWRGERYEGFVARPSYMKVRRTAFTILTLLIWKQLAVTAITIAAQYSPKVQLQESARRVRNEGQVVPYPLVMKNQSYDRRI
jgi:hypothetical protein